MNEHFISRLAVYLLSVVMLIFGIYHLMMPKMWLVYVPDFIPGGVMWVYFTGVAFIIAAISFFTNRLVKIAGYMLAALLLAFVLTIHLPNYMDAGNLETRQQALVNLLKDTALMGFALFVAANAKHQRINEADTVTARKITVIETGPVATV